MASPYEHEYNVANKIYHFNSSDGITCKLIFFRNRHWFPNNPKLQNIFLFDLLTDSPPKRRDERISATVAQIISERILLEPDQIITFLCDDEDGKALLRCRKFNAWYRLCNQDLIHKHDRNVYNGGILTYTSILIHSNNPNYTRVVQLYKSGDPDVSEKFGDEI